MTTFLIRDAAPADMVALREVFRRSALFHEDDRLNLLANPDALELPDTAVREGRARGAVVDDCIVGFATARDLGDATEVEDLFVDPSWMKRGAGRALMLDVIAIARRHGAGRIEVTANPHARPFYEKFGFVVGGQVETRFGPAPRMHLDSRQ